MINRAFNATALLSVVIVCLILSGCSVGAKVTVSARQMLYPVSFTDSFYNEDNTLITEDSYEALHDFDLSFTKWGVSSVIELRSNEDISARLNSLIDEYGGDAIVGFKLSVNNPSVKNSFLWIFKSIAIGSTAFFTYSALNESNLGFGAVAIGSAALAVFMPATAEINLQGTVVRFTETSSHMHPESPPSE